MSPFRGFRLFNRMEATERMYSVEQRGDAVIIHVKGDLDVSSAPYLGSTIALAEGGAGTRIVVQMDSCGFCDSAGLAVLAMAAKRNGSAFFVVLPAAAPCRRSFEVTGLSVLIQIVSTLQLALDVELTPGSARRPAAGQKKASAWNSIQTGGGKVAYAASRRAARSSLRSAPSAELP